MTASKISVFIVDDYPLMRQALRETIRASRDMEIAGEAEDGTEAMKRIPSLALDVVVMGLGMPNMAGIQAIKSLSLCCPTLPVLAFSNYENEDILFRAVQAGARGFLPKVAQKEEILKAIRTMSKGESYLASKLVEKLMKGIRKNSAIPTPKNGFERLTKRERDVLRLLAKGYSNKQIGEALVISESTVRVHFHSIMRKMRFASRREAVVYAVQQGKENMRGK